MRSLMVVLNGSYATITTADGSKLENVPDCSASR
jgi:hypothetical protein